MMGYGLAFVIGFFFGVLGRSVARKSVLPWSPALIAWGLTFMVLDWLASLG